MNQDFVYFAALGVGGLVGAGVSALLVYRLGLVLVHRHGHDWTDAMVVEGVGFIAGVGEVQSFVSIRALGLLGRLQEWEADTFPATLDVFSIIMALAALRARREGKRDRYAEMLAVAYAVAAVSGNLLLALSGTLTDNKAAFELVAALVAHGGPPLTAILGCHWLMRRSERVHEFRVGQDAGRVAAEAATVTAVAPPPAAPPVPPPPSPPDALPPTTARARGKVHGKARAIAGPAESPQRAKARKAWVRAVHSGTEDEWTGTDVQAAAGDPAVPDRTARRWLTEFREQRVQIVPPKEASG